MSINELINGEPSVLFRPQINHFAFVQEVFFIKLTFEPLSKEFSQSHIDHYSRAVKFFNPLTGPPIIISMCYKRIDKTNIPSMRRV